MLKAVEEVTFRKLDNAAIVDFLTSSASAFFENNKIAQKDIDNLRLILSGIGSSSSRDEPILIALDQQHTEFLKILEIRFGVPRLVQNILSYCLRPRLIELQAVLAQYGSQLLKKSELYFNRTFKIYEAGQYLDDQLAPGFIVSYCQAVKATTQKITDLIEGFSCFHGSCTGFSTDEDLPLDRSLALGLGFNRVQNECFESHLPTLGENLHDIERLLVSFFEQVGLFQTQLIHNNLCQNHTFARVLRHELMVELDKLKAISCYSEKASFEGDNLVVQEVFRRQILMSFDTICFGLKQWLDFILNAMRGVPGESIVSHEISDATCRKMVCALVESGVSPSHAQEALHSLLRYQNRHQVAADEILAGELGRIHPALKPAGSKLAKILLNRFQGNSDHSDLMTAKSEAISRSKDLMLYFQKTLSQTTLLVSLGLWPVFLSTLTGCGLKGNPVSEVPALRPDIPFKTGSKPLFRSPFKTAPVPNSGKILKSPPTDTQKP